MDEGITMSQREVDRLEVVQQVADRQLGQARAAQRLAVSVRQVKRLVRAYRSAGRRAWLASGATSPRTDASPPPSGTPFWNGCAAAIRTSDRRWRPNI